MSLFGLDSEGNCGDLLKSQLRLVQIYNPEKDKVTLFHRLEPGSFAVHVVDMKDLETCLCPSNAITWNVAVVSEEKLKELLTDSNNEFVTHSGTWEHSTMYRELGIWPNITEDSYVLGRLVPAPISESRSLDSLMKKYVNPAYDKYKFGHWNDEGQWENRDGSMGTWDGPLSSEMALYGARDAKACYEVCTVMKKDCARYANQCYRLEVQMLKVMAAMQLWGVVVNKAVLADQLVVLKKRLEISIQALSKIRGKLVKVGSPRDLAKWLFEERGNVPKLLTEKGAPSASEDALDQLDDPIVPQIKEAKTLTHLVGMMNSALTGEEAKPFGDGLLIYHPEYRSLTESDGSGRMVSKPGLLVWPWPVREGVIPRGKGHQFYFADISAAELMVAAFASQEEALINTYLAGGDIHRQTASAVFNIPPEQVTQEQRDKAKIVVYATTYGSEGHSVARALGISQDEAYSLIQAFFDKNQKIRALRDKAHAYVCKTGLAVTPFGRFRRVGFPRDPNSPEGRKMCRQAFNTMLQSGAADVQKLMLARLQAQMPVDCRLVYTVYDSVLIEMADPSQKDLLDALLREALTVTVDGRLWKFRFKSGVGSNWKAAHDSAEGK